MSFKHAALLPPRGGPTPPPLGRDMGWTRAPGPSQTESTLPAASEAETAADIAALISINNQLQLPEAAEGMLAFSRELGVEPQVRTSARRPEIDQQGGAGGAGGMGRGPI